MEMKFNQNEIKSEIIIGNITVLNPRRFNRFQKFMIKVCFGFIVKDYKKDGRETV